MANAINWFEIPASDFNRAVSFYSQVLGSELPIQNIMNTEMAFLPVGEGEVGGAVCSGQGYTPSEGGALIFLNGGNDLGLTLGKVEGAGGKITLPKTKISDEIGYIAHFIDSEGNRLGLHSPN